LAHPHESYGLDVPRVTTDKPTGKPISAPLATTTFYRDNEHNNQIVGDKQVLDNTSRGASEVQSKMIFMGHQISSCHDPVVRSFFIL
jgi:hypothetical protein